MGHHVSPVMGTDFGEGRREASHPDHAACCRGRVRAGFARTGPGQSIWRTDKIQFDPPGADNGSDGSLKAEYIVIKNTGSNRVGMGGWTIRDTSGHVYRFAAGVLIGAGAKVTLHTGSGTNRFGHVYWD